MPIKKSQLKKPVEFRTYDEMTGSPVGKVFTKRQYVYGTPGNLRVMHAGRHRTVRWDVDKYVCELRIRVVAMTSGKAVLEGLK